MDPDSELVEFKNELKGFRIAKSPKKLLKYVLSQEDNGDAIQSLKKYFVGLQFLERMVGYIYSTHKFDWFLW